MTSKLETSLKWDMPERLSFNGQQIIEFRDANRPMHERKMYIGENQLRAAEADPILEQLLNDLKIASIPDATAILSDFHQSPDSLIDIYRHDLAPIYVWVGNKALQLYNFVMHPDRDDAVALIEEASVHDTMMVLAPIERHDGYSYEEGIRTPSEKQIRRFLAPKITPARRR